MISVERRATPVLQPLWLGGAEECVVFALCAQTYAVAAERLLTCLSLPRLTALDETPDYLVGAFDLRGELAPVVSPAVLGGSMLRPAASGDLLIVVDADGHPLAFHADAMLGIEPLSAPPPVLTPQPSYGHYGQRAGLEEAFQVSLSGGRARYIDPSLIGLVANTGRGSDQSADERLSSFERKLDAADLALLETRAERYRRLPRVGQRRRRNWSQASA